MQIQVNTDANIEGHEALAAHVREVVEHELAHYAMHVTRVEVHLNDENAGKTAANDKRCMMEVRLAGQKPHAVTDHADSLHQAISGAAEKLRRTIETKLGKLEKR